MQKQSENDVPTTKSNINTGVPPKRKPPKLRKGPPPEQKANGVNGSTTSSVPDLTHSNSPSSNSGSTASNKEQSEGKSPSPEPIPQVERQRTRHHRRARQAPKSQEPDQYQETDSEQRENRSQERRKIKEKRVSRVLNPAESHGEVAQPRNNAGGLVPTAQTGGVEQVTESIEEKPQSGKSDQLRLRLDLNLDIEVELKAKIRGDLTLQLLYVPFKFSFG